MVIAQHEIIAAGYHLWPPVVVIEVHRVDVIIADHAASHEQTHPRCEPSRLPFHTLDVQPVKAGWVVLREAPQPARAMAVLERAAAGRALEVIPLLRVARVHAANVAFPVTERLVAAGADG